MKIWYAGRHLQDLWLCVKHVSARGRLEIWHTCRYLRVLASGITRRSVSQIGCAMLRVCIASIRNVERSLLPRDAMHKRGLCCYAVSACPCVRVSVTFVSCVKTNKDIFELFSPSGRHAILVFHAKRDGDIPTVTP